MRKSVLLVAILALAGSGLALASGDLADASEPYLIPGSRVSPDFPPAAYAARFGSTVVLKATVLSDGSVGGIEVLDTTRRGLGFESAAEDAVKQWRFEPAVLDGKNVDSQTLVRISFRAPSSGRREGFVSAQFLPTPISIGGIGGGGGKSPGTGGMSPDGSGDNKRGHRYGLPPTCVGCLYDRNDLMPKNVERGDMHPNSGNQF